MNVLLVVLVSAALLLLAGRYYGRFLAKSVGEDPSRPTPAVTRNDGADYVPTPTPVVFAHHFASIAGAGPILGPVIAIIYGWGPAIAWVVLGGIFLGGVHDYLATHMATREGGRSIATIARRHLGPDAFVALTIFLILSLALVCAAFLNASATALTSMVPFDRLDLSHGQTLFRVKGEKVVIGGIASMSVIIITAVAPLLGWLYLKRRINVWACSALAVVVCAVSITVGLYYPVQVSPLAWKLLLSFYVLVAAGVPVWIFLQSRDFINVHILYVGMAALFVTLIVAGARGAGVHDPLPITNVAEGGRVMHAFLWPMMFITIACGAVSGFHSLCASGTTCKQLNNERSVRRIGYNAMLLESFLAVCVIAVLMLGAVKSDYLATVHSGFVTPGAKGNPVLGFALAVGYAGAAAFGISKVVGTLAGMILLEGFLVTTLDTAIRLTRYLVEEIWRSLFGRYDVFAEARSRPTPQTPVGTGGMPSAPPPDLRADAPGGIPTRGGFRRFLQFLRLYWFNSGVAVALMLLFAFSGGVGALWAIFATSNQLLAAMGLSLGAIWLLRNRKRAWFAVLPAIFMLVTTSASMILLGRRYYRNLTDANPANDGGQTTLLVADLVMAAITLYLVFAGVRTLLGVLRERRAAVAATAGD